jgi:hypothetical protein
MKMVALGRVVLASRKHVIAMQPRGKGLMDTPLRARLAQAPKLIRFRRGVASPYRRPVGQK